MKSIEMRLASARAIVAQAEALGGKSGDPRLSRAQRVSEKGKKAIASEPIIPKGFEPGILEFCGRGPCDDLETNPVGCKFLSPLQQIIAVRDSHCRSATVKGKCGELTTNGFRPQS